VTMDGGPLAERLEGIALSIDPGAHAFTFETAGQSAVRRNFVIREGDKERRERIVFGVAPAVVDATVPGAAPATSVASSAPAEAPPAGASRPLSTRRIVALTSAGVGVVGLALGIGFGLDSKSKHDDAAKVCPDQCTDPHGAQLWSDARSAGNVSTVAFIVGAVGIAGGAALWLTDKPAATEAPGTQLGFGPGSIQLKGVW
jgi:hypothetical protein